MGKRGTGPLPPEVSVLQEALEAWRRTRAKGAATPSAFWATATELAMQFGVCMIGRAVGLDYGCLRRQVAKARAKQLSAPVTFVELPGTLLVPTNTQAPVLGEPGPSWSHGTGPVIELSTPDGACMRITLESGLGAEAALVVAAFLMRGH